MAGGVLEAGMEIKDARRLSWGGGGGVDFVLPEVREGFQVGNFAHLRLVLSLPYQARYPQD